MKFGREIFEVVFIKDFEQSILWIAATDTNDAILRVMDIFSNPYLEIVSVEPTGKIELYPPLKYYPINSN